LVGSEVEACLEKEDESRLMTLATSLEGRAAQAESRYETTTTDRSQVIQLQRRERRSGVLAITELRQPWPSPPAALLRCEDSPNGPVSTYSMIAVAQEMRNRILGDDIDQWRKKKKTHTAKPSSRTAEVESDARGRPGVMPLFIVISWSRLPTTTSIVGVLAAGDELSEVGDAVHVLACGGFGRQRLGALVPREALVGILIGLVETDHGRGWARARSGKADRVSAAVVLVCFSA
jgi:hypothetical protein